MQEKKWKKHFMLHNNKIELDIDMDKTYLQIT